MLAKRIIPCLDVNRGRVVKGTNFINLRDAGDPIEIAQQYERDGADELVFLDITASHEGRDIMADLVRRVAEEVFMPFCVGGGIRTLEDATRLIHAGAEKVSLNTSAVQTPELITQISRKFGSNACVVNIDPRRNRKAALSRNPSPPAPLPGGERGERRAPSDHGERGEGLVPLSPGGRGVRGEGVDDWYEVYTHGGRTPTGLEAVAWAKEVERLGAGEIVLTCMDNDGTKNGYEVELTRLVAEAVTIPVVASGGAGHPEHLFQVLTAGKADAALAASIFHYGEYPVPVTKRYLAERGVVVRL
ncbi:MAG: imidazole glycerol phosphate synthase subunit HisF [Gemmatales bacterium]